MEASAIAAPPPVGLSLEGPRQVRRVTVAFRAILVIPHWLYLGVLSLVGFLAVILAWFAALFTGRMPDGIGDFVSSILQYSVRVNAYMYLLTDQYPPFDLGAPDYAVTVVLPPRGRLNRAAVLFRFVLAVPALIVATLVSAGLQIPLFFIWLIVLVAGRMPSSIFEAEAAVIRYQARLYAWLLMLTSAYPGGLFGDPPPTGAPGAAGMALPPPPPPPTPSASGLELPALEMLTVVPRITRLVLSKAGKRLVVLFIVLGSLIYVGEITVGIILGGQTSEALRSLDRDYGSVVTASRHYGATIQACGLSGGVDCVHAADRDMAAAARQFATDLGNDKFPSSALGSAAKLRDDATTLSGILDRMVATSDIPTYQSFVAQFQTTGARLDQDYRDLHDLLAFGS
jgi:hypothetical protein